MERAVIQVQEPAEPKAKLWKVRRRGVEERRRGGGARVEKIGRASCRERV